MCSAAVEIGTLRVIVVISNVLSLHAVLPQHYVLSQELNFGSTDIAFHIILVGSMSDRRVQVTGSIPGLAIDQCGHSHSSTLIQE